MPSQAYLQSVAEQTEHHRTSKTFSGSLLTPHIPRVVELARQLGCGSVLDYGCGKGVQYREMISLPQGQHGLERGTLEELLRVKATKFDPCVPEFMEEPKPGAAFDLVIVSHVLFWIPTEDLRGWVIPRLLGHARKLLFIVETIGEEKKKILSDRDAHPRGLSALDWIEMLLPHRKERLDVRLVTEYRASDGRIYPGEWKL